ncbi:gamma-glutamyltransferase family protein [Salsuginibacillus kocurii]|uniref:gamma-glutamyltransferase family protein n=1 Tax=Salsuginibacillus kocurii TaxID=427078 RepID=UPI00037D4C50|nr:gamma-glutamyltransferase [Salsuginibacillus kocurii]
MFYIEKVSVRPKRIDPRRYYRHRGYILVAAVLLFLVTSGCAPDEELSDEPEEPQDEENDTEEEEENAEGEKEEAEERPDSKDADNGSEGEEADSPSSYGVNAGHPAAVDAGMEVLENGGSAADAAIAAAYAVSVVEPFASGIGGGGVTLIQEQGEEPEAYDYREVVPEGGVPASNIGVPGFVSGMTELHADYGAAEWKALLDPAIELAESSEVSDLLATQLQSAQARLPVQQLDHFYPDGAPLGAGETLEQAELAETLREIRDNGGQAFYEGNFAEGLASQVEGLDMESFSNFEVGQHEPVSGEFAGYEVIGAPPPLPGASVIQMLQLIEERGSAQAERNSIDWFHDIAMSWNLSRQFLETDFGDPGFVDVPVENMTDAQRNASLAEELSSDSLLSVDPGQPYGGFDPNTTHITAVDAEGTVVSMTNTLTSFWGSGEYSEGFFFNDQMARFSIGQGDNNEAEPGRRSITWSSPIMIADEEGPVMGIGSPGGERIPAMLTQVVADWAQGTDLEKAVEANRFHIEDDALIMEEQPPPEQREELMAIGYSELRDPPTPLYFGSVQALAIDREQDELLGATDHRREAEWQMETAE